jgi:hypothetical protein
MTENHAAERLIARYTEAVEPSEAELAAVWRDVSDPDAERRIPSGRARPAPGRGLRLAVGGGLVALAAAAAVAWWLGSMSRHAAVVAEDAGSQAPYGAEADEHGQRAVRREPARTVTGTSMDAEAEAAAGSDMPMTADAPGRARDAAPTVAAPRSRPRAPKLDPLVRETSILRRAEASLRKGDPAGALDVLAEHGRELPESKLAVERAALRVIALCRSGKKAQGRGEAVLLERHAASGPYRERIRRSCADD